MPLIRDGAGWSTSITIVNLGNAPANFMITFMKKGGLVDLWQLDVKAPGLTVSNGSVNGLLPAGGFVEIETPGTGDGLTQGYAEVISFNKVQLSAQARLRRTDGSTSRTAAVVSFSPELEDRFYLAIDQSQGEDTTLVWINDTGAALVDLVFRDLTGKVVFADTYQFGASEKATHAILGLRDRYPQLAQFRGVLEGRVSFPGADIYERLSFSGIALQSSATGLMTVIPTMAPAPNIDAR